jgi:hypothetical protein
MTLDFFSEIKNEIRTREKWEEKQAAWYRMRYEGIKRTKKPYPGAPDMHYPLVDTMIEKIKPFYIGQIYGQERLAAFTSGKPQAEDFTTLSEKLFDYTLKQRTNFENTIYTSIDHMLMYGRGPIKVYWSAENQKIEFSPVRPIYLIAPSWTEDLPDADWLVHVMHLSKAQYLRNKTYNQDESFIKSITGRGNDDSGAQTSQQQSILRREGITHGAHDHMIVIWEVYSRDSDGNIKIDTISPMAGWDKPIRSQFGLPYKHGGFPFADLRYEITDPDYYAPRGIAEVLSHHEMDLNKLWNHKLQHLDFSGQPAYLREVGAVVSTTNLKQEPGRILPEGVVPVESPGAPLDFEKEMQLQRALSEDRVQVPDLSAGQHLTGKRGAKGEVTATQINALVQQAAGGNDMRARVFRLQLSRLYQQGWSLVCQYDESGRVLEDFTQVPNEALHDEYRIMPSGSADGLTKEQRIAKALTYKQVFQGSPNIKQNELDKWVLEQDDADLVKRFYQDPEDEQAGEMQKQAEEFLLMDSGFPPRVLPQQDDAAHFHAGMQWMEHKRVMREPIKPATAQLALVHFGQHEQQAKQKKDQNALAAAQQWQPYANILQQILAAAQSGQPGGVINVPQPNQIGAPALASAA